jgi:hypothetical protein
MAARIEAVHDDVARLDDFEAPRLRVVAAGRPARLVEDVFQDGIDLQCLPLCPLRRAAPLMMAIASRCSGWRLPPGRQVCTSLLR